MDADVLLCAAVQFCYCCQKMTYDLALTSLGFSLSKGDIRKDDLWSQTACPGCNVSQIMMMLVNGTLIVFSLLLAIDIDGCGTL